MTVVFKFQQNQINSNRNFLKAIVHKLKALAQ